MKYFLISLITMLIFLSGCAGSFIAKGEAENAVLNNEEAKQFEVFEGSAQGYRGRITVQVLMEGSQIADIIVIDSAEDRFVGGAAIEELIDTAIMYNTIDLDAVSGATESSKGFLEAVQNAILKL